jgi:DNA repair exonuclease SbcCD ATPase subunit
MNPQLNKVFSKLAKADNFTKLASQKVELGLIDDLNKALENSEEVIDRLKEGNALIKRDTGFLEKEKKTEQKLVAVENKARDAYVDKEDKLLIAKRLFEDAENKLDAAKEQVKKNEKSQEELIKRIENFEKKKVPVIKKAQNIISVFEKNIKKAEAAAKDLGLKLPIAKYTKAQDNLRKNL